MMPDGRLQAIVGCLGCFLAWWVVPLWVVCCDRILYHGDERTSGSGVFAIQLIASTLFAIAGIFFLYFVASNFMRGSRDDIELTVIYLAISIVAPIVYLHTLERQAGTRAPVS